MSSRKRRSGGSSDEDEEEEEEEYEDEAQDDDAPQPVLELREGENLSDLVGQSKDIVFVNRLPGFEEEYWPAQIIRDYRGVPKSVINMKHGPDDVLVLPFNRWDSKKWIRADRCHSFPDMYRDLRQRNVGSPAFWAATQEAKAIYNQLLEIQRSEQCYKCKKGDNDEFLLLCTKCNRGCHTYCDDPVLNGVPEGDWFCYKCREPGDWSRKRAGDSPEKAPAVKRQKT